MSHSKNIITMTVNPCIDISGETAKLEPGKKLRCTGMTQDPGGGGINVSRAIAILGGKSTAVFAAGGRTGKTIEAMLQEEGIDNVAVPISGSNRQNVAIREQKNNRQYRFAFPGPEFEEEDWRTCLHKITELGKSASYLVASGSLPPGVPTDFYGRLAEYFADSSTKVIVDTSGDPLKLALDQRLYLIKPNREELEYVCGCSLTDESVQEEACRTMITEGRCKVLVLTLGRSGALLTSAEEQRRIPGIEVEEVSSVGAGDSFVGALVLALQRGDSLRSASLFAMAAGASALTTKATKLCRRQYTGKLYEQLRERLGS